MDHCLFNSILKHFKTILLSVCFIGIFTQCFSQERAIVKNAFYLELFGNGGFYSINYERCLQSHTLCRIGFSTFQTTDLFVRTDPGRITTFPLLVSHLSGHNKHHFELGGGLLLGKWRESSETGLIFNLTSFIGYRFQPPGQGFLLRIGLAPMVSLNKTNYPESFFISPGLSLGYHF